MDTILENKGCNSVCKIMVCIMRVCTQPYIFVRPSFLDLESEDMLSGPHPLKGLFEG